MPDHSLPELARSLRVLGAARDPATEAAHDAIFAPLIAARGRAARGQGAEVVLAFRGVSLLEAIDRAVSAAATAGIDEPALARARSAAGRDAIEPLRAALLALDQPAGPASASAPGSADWDAWIGALRRAFLAADEACPRLARVLAVPVPGRRQSRWLRRR